MRHEGLPLHADRFDLIAYANVAQGLYYRAGSTGLLVGAFGTGLGLGESSRWFDSAPVGRGGKGRGREHQFRARFP
jgi:hypothetical protein